MLCCNKIVFIKVSILATLWYSFSLLQRLFGKNLNLTIAIYFGYFCSSIAGNILLPVWNANRYEFFRSILDFIGFMWIKYALISLLLVFEMYVLRLCISWFNWSRQGLNFAFLLPMAWSREGCEWFDFRFWETAAGQLSTAPRCSTSYWMCSNLWAFDADAKTSPAGFIDLALRQQSFNRLA